MKRWIPLALFFVVCAALLGCATESTVGTDETPVALPTLVTSITPVQSAPIPTPTLSPTPTPLPDIQATIRAGVRATIDNIPTPTFTPTSTFTPIPTATNTPSPTPSPIPSPLLLPGLLPMLKDGAVINPPSAAPSGQTSYSSGRFWYTIDVPEGWGLDASLDELIGMWDPETGAAVWVHVQEIDPESFPNLDDYVAAFRPAANEKITDFTVLGQSRVGSNGPMESEEFSVRFTYRDVTYRAFLRWHLLGRHLASVWAMAEESVLDQEQFADLRQLLNVTMGSFKPWVKYNPNIQYALSHPLEWQDGMVSGLDYWAFDPDSSRQISVRVEPFSGATDVSEYGSNITMFDATIDWRGIVFPGRTRPSYRIDYTTMNRTTGTSYRGSMLITLSGSDAVSVIVVGDAEEWEATRAVAEEIFLRFRVNR